jgi:hypothetical protein
MLRGLAITRKITYDMAVTHVLGFSIITGDDHGPSPYTYSSGRCGGHSGIRPDGRVADRYDADGGYAGSGCRA